jgi:glutathione S-transferase
MITIHGMTMSGNCWKPAQLLRLLGIAYRWVETDPNLGDCRTPDYLAMNPQGEVPVLVLEDGTVLTQSNAMLCHFAEGTAWLPPPGLARTRAMQWLFWEQYSHEPYIAVARNLIFYRGQKAAQAERLKLCAERGNKALGVMEQQLAKTPYLASDRPSVADLALFAYTHVADEGEFDLSLYPAVTAWLARMAAIPGIEPLPRPAGPASA